MIVQYYCFENFVFFLDSNWLVWLYVSCEIPVQTYKRRNWNMYYTLNYSNMIILNKNSKFHCNILFTREFHCVTYVRWFSFIFIISFFLFLSFSLNYPGRKCICKCTKWWTEHQKRLHGISIMFLVHYERNTFKICNKNYFKYF